MNSLIITLCILIEMTVIIAETEMLLATNSSTMGSRNRQDELFSLLRIYLSLPAAISYSVPAIPPKFLYNYNYNTDTGIQAQEVSYLKNVGTNQEALEAQGSYSYTDNEGNTFKVSYIANKNGFLPHGAHLPTLPPLIEKALLYIAEHSEGNGKE